MIQTESPSLPFLGFFYQLRDDGLDVGLNDMLDFYRGMQKGLVNNLDDLFLLGRLCFIRKVAQYDRYYRIFQRYFFGVHLPPVLEGDPGLLQTKAFADWLEEAMTSGQLNQADLWRLSREELMRRFWDTLKRQTQAHHGGNRWVGTGGTSPYGHSGHSARGIRVQGDSKHRSGLRVFGDRRYLDYDADQTLSGENLNQALASLRHLKPVGAHSELDIDATIDQTAKQGGEIELVFNREQRDRLRLLVFFDNGGQSMLPFVQLTRLLFSKIKNRFRDFQFFYFHNTIFRQVYSDPKRSKPHDFEKILLNAPDTKVFIVGDACMAPEELIAPYGAQSWEDSDPEPSYIYLERLQARFSQLVWLNPIQQHRWAQVHGAWTLHKISKLFHMEDLSLGGIRRAVDYLTKQDA